MSTKLNNSKSRIVLLTANRLTTNLKYLHGLKNISISSLKPTKYIVTLKPRTNGGTDTISDIRKVIISADDVLNGKSIFDSKFDVKNSKLEKIDEQSENSNTSLGSNKYNLKNVQSITNMKRLRGGWGKSFRRRSSKRTSNENDGKSDSIIEKDEESKKISLNNDDKSEHSKSSYRGDQVEENEKKLKNSMSLGNGESNENANFDKEIRISSNNQDIKEHVALDLPIVLENKSKPKMYSDQFSSTSETKETSEQLTTTSVNANVLKEITPIPSSPLPQCQLKDHIPICGKTLSTQTQCDLLNVTNKEDLFVSKLFCVLPRDEDTCNRIIELEKQVNTFYVELKDLRKELLTTEDLAKFNIISRNFIEVNKLLMDLKQNCLKLQQMHYQKDNTIDPPLCSCIGMCNCGINYKFDNRKRNYFENGSASEWMSEYYVSGCNRNVYGVGIPESYRRCDCCENCEICKLSKVMPYLTREESALSQTPRVSKIDKHFSIDWSTSPGNSQLNLINTKENEVSKSQNDNQINTNKLDEYNRPRNSAGVDKLLVPLNKETKTESNIGIQNSISTGYIDLTKTRDNLRQGISKIIDFPDNNYQLSTNGNFSEKIDDENNIDELLINMTDPNKMYTRIQSVRVKNLEEQVQLMYGELQQIREGVLTHKDLKRLGNLLERLKELNAILVELRNHYMQENIYGNEEMKEDVMKSLKIQNEKMKKKYPADEVMGMRQAEYKTDKFSPRENAGNDRIASLYLPKQQVNKEESHDNTAASFKSCKELMDEKKPPGSILGNYLSRLQDFRTDPELRRKRWERKQQEKLQQLQKRNNIMKLSEEQGTSAEATSQNNIEEHLNEKQNSSSTKTNSSIIENDGRRFVKRIREVSTDSGLGPDLPLIENNLSEVVYEIISDIDRDAVALTVVLESDFIYHISVSLISSGHSLSCFLATDEAIQEAKRQHLFQNILTFFVVNAEYTDAQKDRILGHSFEFMKMNMK
ncbi:uncharacterized protein ACRADG_005999 [Cochliomyia hominivorax]